MMMMMMMISKLRDLGAKYMGLLWTLLKHHCGFSEDKCVKKTIILGEILSYLSLLKKKKKAVVTSAWSMG